MRASIYAFIGTCTKRHPAIRSGLPDEDVHGSESDSDYEDEDDEDSNGAFQTFCIYLSWSVHAPAAEDWYKNDYPEDEIASDEGVFDSEGSGMS